MKILVAHTGSVSCDAAVEDMRRAGLPETGRVLVLCGAGTVSQRIQSYLPQWTLFSEMLSGSPAEVILNTSGWWRPDLLIIGSDAFAPERSMTNNVSLEVVHRARCSVRLVRPVAVFSAGPIRLVIGNAGSKECKGVIDEVARRQWPENTEAHIVSVVETERPSCPVDSIERLRNAGLKVSRKFIDGDPPQVLVREAEQCNADAIFIGPRCPNDARRFLLGSVATAVVTRARSTVEVVRQPS